MSEQQHQYTERDGFAVCERCGMVRNETKPTACRGALPRISTRDEAKCSVCGRAKWSSARGMGGGLLPDDDEQCLTQGGRACLRTAKTRRDTLREVARMMLKERDHLTALPGSYDDRRDARIDALEAWADTLEEMAGEK